MVTFLKERIEVLDFLIELRKCKLTKLQQANLNIMLNLIQEVGITENDLVEMKNKLIVMKNKIVGGDSNV